MSTTTTTLIVSLLLGAPACGGVLEAPPVEDAGELEAAPAKDAGAVLEAAPEAAVDAHLEAAAPAFTCAASSWSIPCGPGDFVCYPPATNKPMNCNAGACSPGWKCLPYESTTATIVEDAGAGVCAP